MGFRVKIWGLGCRVKGLGLGIQVKDLGYRVTAVELRTYDLGFRVQGTGSGIQGLGLPESPESSPAPADQRRAPARGPAEPEGVRG